MLTTFLLLAIVGQIVLNIALVAICFLSSRPRPRSFVAWATHNGVAWLLVGFAAFGASQVLLALQQAKDSHEAHSRMIIADKNSSDSRKELQEAMLILQEQEGMNSDWSRFQTEFLGAQAENAQLSNLIAIYRSNESLWLRSGELIREAFASLEDPVRQRQAVASLLTAYDQYADQTKDLIDEIGESTGTKLDRDELMATQHQKITAIRQAPATWTRKQGAIVYGAMASLAASISLEAQRVVLEKFQAQLQSLNSRHDGLRLRQAELTARWVKLKESMRDSETR